jgi:hypothetical protein
MSVALRCGSLLRSSHVTTPLPSRVVGFQRPARGLVTLASSSAASPSSTSFSGGVSLLSRIALRRVRPRMPSSRKTSSSSKPPPPRAPAAPGAAAEAAEAAEAGQVTLKDLQRQMEVLMRQ